MIKRMQCTLLGFGLCGVVLLAVASARGDGPSIGIGFGGGGGGVHGGVGFGGGGGGYHGGGYGGGYGGGHHGGYYGGSDFRWGVNVPLSSDGSVRLGVGSGGGYNPSHYYRYYDHPHGYGYGYGGYYSQSDNYYYAPSNNENSEQPAASETPPVPTAGQAGRMSDEQLADMLGWISEGYAKELGDIANGNTWKKYFKLAEVLEIAKKSKSGSLSDADRTTLGEIVKRMDSAAKNSDYEVITSSFGFKTLAVVLHEFTLPPKERLGHSLGASLQKFAASLDGVSTGEGWKKHLQIAELGKLLENADSDGVSSVKQLEKILAKFDAVAEKSQFQVIAELDGFTATKAGLQRYIGALQNDQSRKTAPPPPEADTATSF